MTEKTTVSIPLDDLSLEQLVQISQGLGREIDALREKRAYLKAKIEQRLARGERTSTDPAQAQDATAPGAVIEAQAAT
jgi:hypothetical protein